MHLTALNCTLCETELQENLHLLNRFRAEIKSDQMDYLEAEWKIYIHADDTDDESRVDREQRIIRVSVPSFDVPALLHAIDSVQQFISCGVRHYDE